MASKLTKAGIIGMLVVIGTYLWKISLIIIVIATLTGLYLRHKNKSRSEKWG